MIKLGYMERDDEGSIINPVADGNLLAEIEHDLFYMLQKALERDEKLTCSILDVIANKETAEIEIKVRRTITFINAKF